MSNDRMTEVKSVQQEPEARTTHLHFKDYQLIWLVLGILEALIAPHRTKTDQPTQKLNCCLIYGLTYLFLFPFEGMVTTPSAGSMVLELSSFFAMLIYALIAWAVERIVWVLFYRPRGPVVGTTQTTTSERHINP
jgi:hypothetical protein